MAKLTILKSKVFHTTTGFVVLNAGSKAEVADEHLAMLEAEGVIAPSTKSTPAISQQEAGGQTAPKPSVRKPAARRKGRQVKKPAVKAVDGPVATKPAAPAAVVSDAPTE